jgi:signal transduction histidine kinase
MNTWQPPPRAWDLYFAVSLVGVAVFALTVNDVSTVRRLMVLGLLGVMAGWYLALGRALVATRHATWRGPVFELVLLGLFAGSAALIGTTTFLLFALCPLVYMTMQTFSAHFVAAAYAFTPAAVVYLKDGPGSLTFTLPLGVIVTTISVVTALTIQRIEHTSEDRAALIEELASTRAELARLSREAGIADERQRLAGDIHDTVAQGLSSVVMLVEAADAALRRDPEAAHAHLVLAARTARENLDEARAIVAALTPSPLADSTLADALRRLSGRFNETEDATATVRTGGVPRLLPTGTEVVLLRVAQEALNNVRKHAKATAVAIQLDYGEDHIGLSIVDDGVGFDVDALAPGYGLGAMRARVEQIGGELAITSGPGTAIRARVTS